MTPALYQQLVARARGLCEACRCSLARWGQEADHIFGRPPRADESEATCWLICPRCHFSRTRNYPNAAHWLRLVVEHFKLHGYAESQQRAEARLYFVETRGALGSALGTRR